MNDIIYNIIIILLWWMMMMVTSKHHVCRPDGDRNTPFRLYQSAHCLLETKDLQMAKINEKPAALKQ